MLKYNNNYVVQITNQSCFKKEFDRVWMELFISVTRLHLKGKRKLPIFLLHTIKSTIQLKKAPGLKYSSFNKEGWNIFWTLTVWENKEHMRNYRNNGNHLKAMKISREVADVLEFINWEADSLPTWDDCKRKLHGKFRRI